MYKYLLVFLLPWFPLFNIVFAFKKEKVGQNKAENLIYSRVAKYFNGHIIPGLPMECSSFLKHNSYAQICLKLMPQ